MGYRDMAFVGLEDGEMCFEGGGSALGLMWGLDLGCR